MNVNPSAGDRCHSERKTLSTDKRRKKLKNMKKKPGGILEKLIQQVTPSNANRELIICNLLCKSVG